MSVHAAAVSAADIVRVLQSRHAVYISDDDAEWGINLAVPTAEDAAKLAFLVMSRINDDCDRAVFAVPMDPASRVLDTDAWTLAGLRELLRDTDVVTTTDEDLLRAAVELIGQRRGEVQALTAQAGAAAGIDKDAFLRAGWRTRFIDDGGGETGWYAYKGDDASSTDMPETDICPDEATAIRTAMTFWSDDFTPSAPAVPEGDASDVEDELPSP